MPFTLPAATGCVFCERLAGEQDDWAVVEMTESTVSFVNPRQFEVGQCLVIPRRHAPTLLDLSAPEAGELMEAVHRLASALVRTYDPDGITVYQNNGVASYQEVPHCHVHVVPRRFGSGWGEGPPHLAAIDRPAIDRRAARHVDATAYEQEAMAAEIRAHIASG